jgi:hypothetical protein
MVIDNGQRRHFTHLFWIFWISDEYDGKDWLPFVHIAGRIYRRAKWLERA